jgi:ferredoxin-NADP reductase
MTAPVAALRRVVFHRIAVPVLRVVTAPHGPDHYLEMINPTWSLREVRAEITGLRRLAVGSVTLLLRPNGNWRGFRAGQHVAFTIEIDGVWRTRCYSLACSAHRQDGLLELTVADEPSGLVSGHLNAAACAGTVVRLSQAQGEFLLPDVRPEHIVLISGGSGITPVMSMVRTLCEDGFCAAGRPGRLTFLHYARSAAHVAYRDELAALAAQHPGLRLVRAYTRDGGGELSGRFQPQHLPAVDDRTGAWVCGPGGLVDAVRAYWERCGISAPLQTEQFTAPALTASVADGEPYGEVRFTRSGRRVANRRHPARAGRERRAASGVRLPDGHLPDLYQPQDRRQRPAPVHR